MRICILTYNFPKSQDEAMVSGVVKNPYYLSIGLYRHGHNVTVLSPSREVKKGIITIKLGKALTVYRISSGSFKGVVRELTCVYEVVRALVNITKQMDFDLFHAHTPSLGMAVVLARKAKLIPPRPVLVTAHGTSWPELLADLKGSIYDIFRTINGWVQRHLDRIALASVDAVQSTSQFQYEELVQLYKVDGSRIFVIHNGVDTDFYRPIMVDRPYLKRRLGLNDGPVVLFVGRLVRKKGLQLLIAAVPEIIRQVPNVSFLVVGGDLAHARYEKELRKQLTTSGFVGRFKWLMSVPEAEMPYVYNAADVCVVPSINYESLPTVVLEAMACGTPVIATKSWGIPEALKDNRALFEEGNVVELAQRVVNVLLDPALAHELAEENLTWIKPFVLKEIVSKLEMLYERMISHGEC